MSVRPTRTVAACAALLLGCAADGPVVLVTEDGFQHTASDPSVDLRGLTVPERCYAGAHTIVVGPGPGCAQLFVAESAADTPRRCASEGEAHGSPLRIVRLGELGVRVDIVSSDGWTTSGDAADLGLHPASRPGESDCCLSLEGGATHGTPGHGAIPFEALAEDGTLELVVTSHDESFEIRVCAVAETPLRAEVEARCLAWCAEEAACGRHDGSECATRCADLATAGTPACHEAELGYHDCLEALSGCVTALEHEPDRRCLEHSWRVEYECGP